MMGGSGGNGFGSVGGIGQAGWETDRPEGRASARPEREEAATATAPESTGGMVEGRVRNRLLHA